MRAADADTLVIADGSYAAVGIAFARLFDEVQPLGFTTQPHIETMFWWEDTKEGFLSAFGRIFQFGMRHGMRSYTRG